MLNQKIPFALVSNIMSRLDTIIGIGTVDRFYFKNMYHNDDNKNNANYLNASQYAEIVTYS